jgi:5-methylcytosine-specific restriction endonuclease McrBC GTP-binding regulatory subunit McrB
LVIEDDEVPLDKTPPEAPGVADPQNLILHGPPGTGKTYATIGEALRLIDPAFAAFHDQDRQALKGRFDELVKAGRVRFVTFHQSLSYEDFVEGLRAGETTAAAGPSFRVEAGTFRQLCQAAAGSVLPHVLVIDEINRGNVSRIFGELLTLIEPGKRAGQPEALEVTLPYSRQRFSVPANVHLIGTMNTADRSLAGLDIALRRRFTFKEMPPRPELLDGMAVQGVNLGALLRVMNERIELLLDRDHLLGHAYLLPLAQPGAATLSRLADVFRQQIVPLLQEYFFEDWERIGWVLNDPAKAVEHRFVLQGGERTAAALFGTKVAEQLSVRRWRLNAAAFEHIEIYRGILAAAGSA